MVERTDTLKRLRELKLIKKFITRLDFGFSLITYPKKLNSLIMTTKWPEMVIFGGDAPPQNSPQRTAQAGLLNVAFIWSHDNRYRSKKWKSRLVFETARGFYFLTGSDLRLDFMASYCQAWNFWWNFSWIFLRQGLVISDIFRLIGLLYRSLLVSLRSFLISIGSFHLRIFFKRIFLNRHKNGISESDLAQFDIIFDL